MGTFTLKEFKDFAVEVGELPTSHHDVMGFVPVDLRKAIGELTNNVASQVGVRTEYSGTLGSLESDITIEHVLNEADKGNLAKGAERNLDKMGRQVVKLSDESTKSAKKVGEAFKKFIGDAGKALKEMKANISKAGQKARETISKHKIGNREAPVHEVTVNGNKLEVQQTASGKLNVLVDGEVVEVVETTQKASEVFAKQFAEQSEKVVKSRVEYIERATSKMQDYLGNVAEAISEFRTENLSKLEEILGREPGKTLETATRTFDVAGPAVTSTEDIAANATKGHWGTPVFVGAAAGAGLGYMMGGEDSKGSSAVIGGGIGAALGAAYHAFLRVPSQAAAITSEQVIHAGQQVAGRVL